MINQNKKRKVLYNVILICTIIILIILPFFIAQNAEFKGTDDLAGKLIEQNNPGYKSWFSSIWEPPSKEIESLLFSLQAAIGSGIIFYVIGYYKGKKQRGE